MASGSLSGLIPTLYEALDIVSREQVGFIPSVAINANASRAAKGQTVRVPIVGAASTTDISAAAYASDTTSETPSYADISISKSKSSKVNWTGEEQRGYGSNGTLGATLAQQFAQAMRALTNEVEADIAATYVSASRAYGDAGTAPFGSTLGAAAQMGKILSDNGAPLMDRSLIINSSAGVNLRSLANLTQADAAGTDATLRGGILLPLSGFNVRESGQIASHTKGTMTGADTTAVEPVGETTIAYDGGGGSTLTILPGDIMGISDDDNLYVVKTGATGVTSSFVIADPGLLVATTADKTLTTGASYAANMAFHKNAIQLVTRMPAMPEGGDMADDIVEIFDPVSGLGFQVALYRQYHQVHYEVGISWGVKMIKPEHCALLLG